MGERRTRLDELEQRFGRNIRSLRQELGLSQADVAAEMTRRRGTRFHQTTVAKVEAGTRPLRLSEAAVIASILYSSIEDLLDVCGSCLGSPPAGFTCNECGTTRRTGAEEVGNEE